MAAPRDISSYLGEGRVEQPIKPEDIFQGVVNHPTETHARELVLSAFGELSPGIIQAVQMAMSNNGFDALMQQLCHFRSTTHVPDDRDATMMREGARGVYLILEAIKNIDDVRLQDEIEKARKDRR